MQLGCKSLSCSVTHGVYFIQSLPLLIRHAQLLCGLDAAAQLAGPNLQILQLLLLHEPSQGTWELQQRMGWDDTPVDDPLLSFKSFHLMGFDCHLWLFVPVDHAARGLRHRPAAPPGCQYSLHVGTGRWFWAGRGCSSGSRQSYSGCGLGCGWRGSAVPRLSP